jgi:hypothetical protein
MKENLSHPGPNPETLNNQNAQKVKTFDPERAIAIRAARSLRQAQEKWSKMKRDYPATIEDHSALERLIADFKGIVTGFFIEGACIIVYNPAIFHFQYCGGLVLPPAYKYLQSRYRIILTPSKGEALTVRDGENLEKQNVSDRDSEEFRRAIENFRSKCLMKKLDHFDHPPDGKERG